VKKSKLANTSGRGKQEGRLLKEQESTTATAAMPGIESVSAAGDFEIEENEAIARIEELLDFLIDDSDTNAEVVI
jgi:hypothetical protein